jgi:hypothetical protein
MMAETVRDAVEALFESDRWGAPGEEPRVSEVWKAIESVVSRAELRAALALVTESAPPPGVDDDWRAALPARYPAVSGFLKMLPAVIEFGASAEGAPVLAAMRALPDVLAYRGKLPAPLIPGRLIDAGVVNGPWRRLVLGHPAHEDGAVSRHAYAFWCSSSSGGTSSAATSGPTPPPGGATRRPACWKARRGRRSAVTCWPRSASRTTLTDC